MANAPSTAAAARIATSCSDTDDDLSLGHSSGDVSFGPSGIVSAIARGQAGPDCSGDHPLYTIVVDRSNRRTGPPRPQAWTQRPRRERGPRRHHRWHRREGVPRRGSGGAAPRGDAPRPRFGAWIPARFAAPQIRRAGGPSRARNRVGDARGRVAERQTGGERGLGAGSPAGAFPGIVVAAPFPSRNESVANGP